MPKKLHGSAIKVEVRRDRKNSTKLHTAFFQHVFIHFLNFQSKWIIYVELTVALKLGVERSNIVDTSNIGCVWHALRMVYC